MASYADIDRMKTILRERDIPFFTDKDLEFYINENGGDVDSAIHQCLLVKAEDTSLTLTGFTAPDTSAYFRRLASKYRPYNTGILRGD